MYQWLNNYEYLIENAKTKEDKIRIILEKHIEFERIHHLMMEMEELEE